MQQKTSSSTKQYVAAAVGIVLAVLLSVFLFSRLFGVENPSPQAKTVDTGELTKTVQNRQELLIGQAYAPVTLIEYIDYKCPNCIKQHRGIGDKLKSEYIATGKVKLLIRAYPLIGPDSGRALRGAYCVNLQNKFGQYHDLLFNYVWDNYYSKGNLAAEIEDVLTTSVLSSIAALAGAETSQFESCVEDTAQNSNIDADLLLAADDGVQGTPTYILDGKKLVGPQPYEVLKALLDSKL